MDEPWGQTRSCASLEDIRSEAERGSAWASGMSSDFCIFNMYGHYALALHREDALLASIRSEAEQADSLCLSSLQTCSPRICRRRMRC